MQRVAILIANSVVPQHTLRGVRRPAVKRTMEQIGALLCRLPEGYAFKVIPLIDRPPSRVRQVVERAASRCTRSRSLLLLYYFGHGRRLKDDRGDEYLAFVHPGRGGDARVFLEFPSLLYTIRARDPHKVLCIIDCCYAGLVAKQFELPREIEYCLMACTTASTRARWEEHVDLPIGTFTRAVMDGLMSATESATSDSITADSLFKFAHKETVRLTSGLQHPYMIGRLAEAISKYSPKPVIIAGISDAPETSAYSKLLAIARVLGKRRFEDLRDLYRAVTYRYRETFLTPYKRADGSILKRLADWTVLRRYISFFRSISVVDEDELMLTVRGLELIQNPSRTYNARLLDLIDRYLQRSGVPRNEIREAMLDILNRRSLPTRNNVLTDLSLAKGYSLNLRNLALVLDLLGYIGAIGMPRPKEQVYFPWAEHKGAGR